MQDTYTLHGPGPGPRLPRPHLHTPSALAAPGPGPGLGLGLAGARYMGPVITLPTSVVHYERLLVLMRFSILLGGMATADSCNLAHV